MKKAVIVGGSNGIGFAIASELSKRGNPVIILDTVMPFSQIDNCTYIKTDLSMLDNDLFEELRNDNDVNTVFITAGFGRICEFDSISETEIDKLYKVNAISATKIIRMFYQRIKSDEGFYFGVMGSIAGLVSSPLFSVYSATKASVCKLIEALNIELEASNTTNRILNVSPGSIKGTKFNGGENDVSLTRNLAIEIVDRLYSRETLYIPDYEKICKGVIDRYNNDSHKFGLDSYEYKIQSGRINTKSPIKIGYLSGTFDLFHVGHLNLIRRAKAECDYLIVGVHPDASHKGKKTVIDFESRMEIVGSCKYVDKVVVSCPEDSEAWEKCHFDKLFVGSDYKGTERFLKYEEYFKDKGVEIIYFPYTQKISSTQIREKITKK